MKDYSKISDFVDGLYVKDGRLINGRPNSMMGIEKASKMRQAVKRQKNIEQIAEGIQRAKMLERFMDQLSILIGFSVSVKKAAYVLGGFFVIYVESQHFYVKNIFFQHGLNLLILNYLTTTFIDLC